MRVITFGRHLNNDVVIQEYIVEKVHAKIIECDDGTFYIEDCQTMNGISVNECMIGGRHAGGGTILHRGDKVMLASYVLDWEKYFVVSLGDRLKQVIDVINSVDFTKKSCLDFVLPLLPAAHLSKGYVLSSFRYGVEGFGYEYIPYVHKRGAIIEWCPPENVNYDSIIRGKRTKGLFSATGSYNDRYYISGIWGYERIIDSVPSILSYFELTFSAEGILDAWILRNLSDLLPKYWHANYGAKTFICEQETIDQLFPEDDKDMQGFADDRRDVKDVVRRLNISELIPQVNIDGDNATFSCTYWNQFSGLYKVEAIFRKEEKRVEFISSHEQCLVHHKSDIMF